MPDLTISVNLSSRNFQQADLVEQVADALGDSGIGAGSLRLEITETLLMQNPEAATQLLARLHNVGVGIAMDDFGSGYSSLSYLHAFPIDVLKIDRSFIMKLHESEHDAAIVRAITMLADHLRLRTVAEGVELPEHLVALRALGCKYGQGYLFSKPVNAEAAAQLLASEPTMRM